MAYSALEENHGRKFYERDTLLNGTGFEEVIIFRPMMETIPPREPITMTLNYHVGTELLSYFGTKVIAENTELKAIKTYGELYMSKVDVSYLAVLDSGVAYIDKQSHIDRLTVNGTVYMDSLAVVKEPIRLETGGRICLLVQKDSDISMEKYVNQYWEYLHSRIDLRGRRGLIIKYQNENQNKKYQFDSIVKESRIWLFTKTFSVNEILTSPS